MGLPESKTQNKQQNGHSNGETSSACTVPARSATTAASKICRVSNFIEPAKRTVKDSGTATSSSKKSGDAKSWHLCAVSSLPSEQRSRRNNLLVLVEDSVRRILDVLGALLLLALLLPLMLAVSIIIRLTSPGPAIYLQRRLTRGGNVFTLFKFRTMRSGAEEKTGAVMAADADQRVTSFGRFLRRTRVDELPQLINVLIGDMSLIGPRPERPELAAELSKELPDMPRRLEVNAGLTGLAQIKAGYASSTESYRKKLDWDIYYVENRTLWLDFKIAIATIWVVLSGEGAR